MAHVHYCKCASCRQYSVLTLLFSTAKVEDMSLFDTLSLTRCTHVHILENSNIAHMGIHALARYRVPVSGQVGVRKIEGVVRPSAKI